MDQLFCLLCNNVC